MKVKPTGYFLIHQYIDISALAQLMRYSHGAGASAEYNPSEKLEGKIEGHASFALGGEGRNGPVPAGQVRCQPFIFGEKVTPQTPDGVCNMGALRFAMKLVLSGSVGASAAIELGDSRLEWRNGKGLWH